MHTVCALGEFMGYVICSRYAAWKIETLRWVLTPFHLPLPFALLLVSSSSSPFPRACILIKKCNLSSPTLHTRRIPLSLSLSLAVTDVARGTVAVAAVATVRDPYS